MSLAVRLTETQVLAAGLIHDQLYEWKTADRVLWYLRETIPGNTEIDHVLLKAAVLNQLYRINVYDLHAMAGHIADIFSSAVIYDDECTQVEQIAYLEATGREYKSFAAKYCHFFVDTERFPLYDRYARDTVRMHLGKGNYRCKTTSETYRNFCVDLRTLRASIAFSPSVRELDHYLWLRGQRETFAKKGDDAPIGTEVKTLFQRADSDERVSTLVREMCGA